MEDSAARPLAVRRCYPQHWFRPSPYEPPAVQRCVGTTAPNGELSFRAVAPKIWSLKDKKEILIELQLDDGTEPTSRVSLVECALMQRLRHREAPVNGSQPPTSSIPSTVTGTVGQPIRTKPPLLAPGSATIYMNFAIPMSALQTDAELDPFLLEHVFQVTVHLSKMMSVKKCTFFLPLKLCMPADDDDRLLAAVPTPVGWFARPQNPQRRSSVALTASSGGSGRDKPKPKMKELADVMSLGVAPSSSSASSASSTKKPGSRTNGVGMDSGFSGLSGFSGGRRKSSSSQGSAGSGGRMHQSQMSALTSGMNDMMLGGGGGGHGMLSQSNSMRSSGGVSMNSRANSQDQWRSPVRYSNASSGSGGSGTPINAYGGMPLSPLSQGSASSHYGVPNIQSQLSNSYDPQNGYANGRPSPTHGAYPITPSSNPSPTTFYAAQQHQQQQQQPSPSLRNVVQPSLPSHHSPSPTFQMSSQQQQQQQHQQQSGSGLAPPPNGPLPPPPMQALPSVPEHPKTVSDKIIGGEVVTPATTTGSHVFRVQYAFTPTLDDEILLEVGDLIEVIEVFDDGWARGRTFRSEGTGYFPVRCLTLPTVTASGTQETRTEREKFEEAHGRFGQHEPIV
ncbi:hypothetical protein HDU67_001495 [Dinochytrium kinnereticum]|nr:hypothetical protein HDU67_001495 [Dinochytrium kinnereticum]